MGAVLIGNGSWFAASGGGGGGGDILLNASHMSYLGGFKVPDSGLAAPNNFQNGGYSVAKVPGADQLVLESRWPVGASGLRVAKITIPTPVNDSTLATMNTASFVDASPHFHEPTAGNFSSMVADNGERFSGGMFFYGGDFYYTLLDYYDSTGTQTASSHIKRAGTALGSGAIAGPVTFANGSINGTTTVARYFSGPACEIPASWQSALGGPMLQSNRQASINGSQSCGPFAAVFDPASIGVTTPVPNTILAGWTVATRYEPNYLRQIAPVWSISDTSMVFGVAFPSGSKTVLFIGRKGNGPQDYGTPGAVSEADGSQLIGAPDGGTVPADPTGSDKGYHAYPYEYHVWAVSAEQLAEVKAGTRQPHQVSIYAHWDLTIPGLADSQHSHDGSACYDDVTKRIYLVEAAGRGSPNSRAGAGQPIVHVFQLSF